MVRQIMPYLIVGSVSLVLIVTFLTIYLDLDYAEYAFKPIMMMSKCNDTKVIEMKTSTLQEKRDLNPLDGCLHVYLDVGSNIGVQVRKLFQPHLFPKAPILAIFDQHFGDIKTRNLRQVCSVGFEPNPIHHEHLQNISTSFKKCGWRAIFYGVGVGSKNDTLRYARIPGPMEWGGIIVNKKDDFGEKKNEYIKDKMVKDVPVVRLAEYILNVVKTRKLPESAKTIKPQVVMKLDIEGKELEVVPDLLVTGGLVFVDKMFLEWHQFHHYVSYNDTMRIKKLVEDICEVAEDEKLLQKCHFQELDDESFMRFKGGLPNCVI